MKREFCNIEKEMHTLDCVIDISEVEKICRLDINHTSQFF